MTGIAKTTAIFLVIAGVLAGGSFLGRDLMHLECVGPVLPAWGCLSAPYPDTLPNTQPALFWIGIVAFGWLACYVIRDLVFKALAFVISKLYPGYLEREFQTHPPVPREYKLR
jgi:hypothetical protein